VNTDNSNNNINNINNNFVGFESDKTGKIKRRTEIKQERRFMGMGASSVLIIFVILCLTTFAVLSLMSSQSDLRMSGRFRDAEQDYYAAIAKTGEILRDIDKILADERKNIILGESSQGYYARLVQAAVSGVEYAEAGDDDGLIILLVPIAGGERSIQTDINILPPENEYRYSIKNRRTVSERIMEEESPGGFIIFD